jgi:subtilisin family serine protease
LNGQYRPQYNGSGSNIFIVDTGIDTNHVEFQGTHRIVQNLYDAVGRSVGADNDMIGHGTHVAATAGGANVGVAAAANIFGVRVMDESGLGTSTDIIDGLSFVLDWFLQNKRPATVVSMSLGGDCLSYEECEKDVIVQACEKLIANGITVVVSAGNDGCDSCLQTPAFAPNVITVGASNVLDMAAVFSDYGKCVDLYAPGERILSACASKVCKSEDAYIELSGTSMSAPHAAGVAAMVYQVSSPWPFKRTIISLLKHIK